MLDNKIQLFFIVGFNFSTQQLFMAKLKLKISAIFIAGFNFSTQQLLNALLDNKIQLFFIAAFNFFNPANIKGFVGLKNSAKPIFKADLKMKISAIFHS